VPRIAGRVKMQDMEKGRRHHYNPIFYLTQWCGLDGRLCEYSRPYRELVADPKFPKQTGFERGLYTLTAYPQPVAEIVEDKLMSRTDNDAARAHQLLLDNNIGGLDDDTKSAWARFIISIWRRTPEEFRGLRDRLTAILLTEHPELRMQGDERDQARRAVLEHNLTLLIQHLLNSELIGNHLINMRWSIVRFDGPKGPLLSSDHPIVRTSSLAHARAHLVMPISPTQCFIASNTRETEEEIRSIPPNQFIDVLNDRMASQARLYVYGLDESHSEFVESRLGRREAT
jgi:hypothetical protein